MRISSPILAVPLLGPRYWFGFWLRGGKGLCVGTGITCVGIGRVSGSFGFGVEVGGFGVALGGGGDRVEVPAGRGVSLAFGAVAAAGALVPPAVALATAEAAVVGDTPGDDPCVGAPAARVEVEAGDLDG